MSAIGSVAGSVASEEQQQRQQQQTGRQTLLQKRRSDRRLMLEEEMRKEEKMQQERQERAQERLERALNKHRHTPTRVIDLSEDDIYESRRHEDYSMGRSSSRRNINDQSMARSSSRGSLHNESSTRDGYDHSMGRSSSRRDLNSDSSKRSSERRPRDVAPRRSHSSMDMSDEEEDFNMSWQRKPRRSESMSHGRKHAAPRRSNSMDMSSEPMAWQRKHSAPRRSNSMDMSNEPMAWQRKGHKRSTSMDMRKPKRSNSVDTSVQPMSWQCEPPTRSNSMDLRKTNSVTKRTKPRRCNTMDGEAPGPTRGTPKRSHTADSVQPQPTRATHKRSHTADTVVPQRVCRHNRRASMEVALKRASSSKLVDELVDDAPELSTMKPRRSSLRIAVEDSRSVAEDSDGRSAKPRRSSLKEAVEVARAVAEAMEKHEGTTRPRRSSLKKAVENSYSVEELEVKSNSSRKPRRSSFKKPEGTVYEQPAKSSLVDDHDEISKGGNNKNKGVLGSSFANEFEDDEYFFGDLEGGKVKSTDDATFPGEADTFSVAAEDVSILSPQPGPKARAASRGHLYADDDHTAKTDLSSCSEESEEPSLNRASSGGSRRRRQGDKDNEKASGIRKTKSSSSLIQKAVEAHLLMERALSQKKCHIVSDETKTHRRGSTSSRGSFSLRKSEKSIDESVSSGHTLSTVSISHSSGTLSSMSMSRNSERVSGTANCA